MYFNKAITLKLINSQPLKSEIFKLVPIILNLLFTWVNKKKYPANTPEIHLSHQAKQKNQYIKFDDSSRLGKFFQTLF